ncbi:hypothetical protein HanXRQr2_Chr14g0644951 [Helianthus annuus]|uniref:Uncharacterized protein n=1 Tax=Helianthus annuus TaxID=4232 RepID=A0A9K3E8L0_HELAN|nr:hypothetical protein HanXRQr2_Chr14g0644951 [Helianthus annuus]KAJ0502822.1 hypothetical protein HanHA300_Chr11g0417301 [Helianthus annuus]KAJ0876590.1 hypothetical protein HanPSC8_Chr11g0490181 [Helianthus annuus]
MSGTSLYFSKPDSEKGCTNKVSEPSITEDELKLILRVVELSGAIEEEEQDMNENVLEINNTQVKEVMTPLVDGVVVDCRLCSATLVDFHHLWVDGLNKFVANMWPYLDKVICVGIRQITEPIFADYMDMGTDQ